MATHIDQVTAVELAGAPVFCSWSGGKDSAFALHEAARAGAVPALLVSMMTEGGERSRSHGLSREVLAAQAAALGLPIRFGAASWAGYEAEFRRVVGAAAAEAGTGAGVFGDIDTQDHRDWVERVCGSIGVGAHLPLWRRDRRELMEEVIASGLEAVVVAVRDGVLPAELLGRTIDAELVAAVEREGADAAGENGEYHSLVVDGPLFGRRLEIEPGERSLRDGVWFLDVAARA